MPDQRLVSLAKDARERADEILTRAETFQDAYAKQKMREIAVKYEELAERLEPSGRNVAPVPIAVFACGLGVTNSRAAAG